MGLAALKEFLPHEVNFLTSEFCPSSIKSSAAGRTTAVKPSTAQAGRRSGAGTEARAVPREWRGLLLCKCPCRGRAARQRTQVGAAASPRRKLSSPGSLRPLAWLYGRRLAQALELAQARDLVLGRAPLARDLVLGRPPLARDLIFRRAELDLDLILSRAQPVLDRVLPALDLLCFAHLALEPCAQLRAVHRLVRVQPRAKRLHLSGHLGVQRLQEALENGLRDDDVRHHSSPIKTARRARAAPASDLKSRRS